MAMQPSNSLPEVRQRQNMIRKAKGWPTIEEEEAILQEARRVHGTSLSAGFVQRTKRRTEGVQGPQPVA